MTVESLSATLRREETEYADFRKHTDVDGYHDRSRIMEAATAWEKERRDVDATAGRMPKNLGTGITGSFLLDRVANVLLDAHTAVKRGGGMTMESLADEVRASRQILAAATPSYLEETAVPVLTRQEPLTAEKITAVRLAALCLTHEPEARRIATLGDTFRTIFAGMTTVAN